MSKLSPTMVGTLGVAAQNIQHAAVTAHHFLDNGNAYVYLPRATWALVAEVLRQRIAFERSNQPPTTSDFIRRTNEDYVAWCATFYIPEALNEQGMQSLHGLWAWQEQERRKLVQQPTAQPPAPAAQPAAPFLFIAMDDDKRASVTWCANEAAVREAAKRSMFWLQPGEELSAEHANELDGCVEELLDSGGVNFEGDPPLYLYRVGRVAQPVQQPGAEPVAYKVRHPKNPKLSYVSTEPPEPNRIDTGEPDEYFGGEVTPLYAHAAPTQRQPLSEVQIHAMKCAAADQGITGIAPSLHLARAVEAAHNITAAGAVAPTHTPKEPPDVASPP